MFVAFLGRGCHLQSAHHLLKPKRVIPLSGFSSLAGSVKFAFRLTSKVVPLPPRAVELLASLPRIEGNPWIIPGRKPGAHLRNLDDTWRAVRARARLDDVRIHDLRHSFRMHPVGPPRSTRFRASRAVDNPEILFISNSPATYGPLDVTKYQIATAGRADDGALFTPTP